MAGGAGAGGGGAAERGRGAAARARVGSLEDRVGPTPLLVGDLGIKKPPVYMGVLIKLAEREGFEPSMGYQAPYSLSRGAPSATRPPLRKLKLYFSRPLQVAESTFVDPGDSSESREGGIDWRLRYAALPFGLSLALQRARLRLGSNPRWGNQAPYLP